VEKNEQEFKKVEGNGKIYFTKCKKDEQAIGKGEVGNGKKEAGNGKVGRASGEGGALEQQ
jgi:hypothetical protein